MKTHITSIRQSTDARPKGLAEEVLELKERVTKLEEDLSKSKYRMHVMSSYISELYAHAFDTSLMMDTTINVISKLCGVSSDDVVELFKAIKTEVGSLPEYIKLKETANTMQKVLSDLDSGEDMTVDMVNELMEVINRGD